MKRRIGRLGWLVLVAALLAGWLVHQHARTIGEYPLKTLSVPPERVSQQHVGELVTGREIIQPLHWRSLRDQSLSLHGEEPFCTGIFFANYFGRDNRGRLVIDLERWSDDQGWQRAARARLDVARVRNYRHESVCFAEVTLDSAAAGPARLRLSVPESPAGAAVTAYLGDYDGQLPTARVDGEAVPATLIHRLQVHTDHGREQAGAWAVLAAVTGVIVAVGYGLWTPPPGPGPWQRVRWRLARRLGVVQGRRRRRLTRQDFSQWQNLEPLPDGRWQALSPDPLLRTPLCLPAGWYRLRAGLRVDHRQEDPRHANLQVFPDFGQGERADLAMGLPLRSGVTATRWLWLPEPGWLRVDPIEFQGVFALDTLNVEPAEPAEPLPPSEVRPDWSGYNQSLARPREETVPYARWIVEEEAGRQAAVRRAAGGQAAEILKLPTTALPDLSGHLQRSAADWVIVMPGADALSALAPVALARAAAEHPDARVIYSDHDYRDAAGFRHQPVFKPAWSPETFEGHDYLGPSVWFQRAWLQAQLAARPAGSGPLTPSALTALAVQAAGPEAIVHWPMVLYHQAADPAPAPPAPAAPAVMASDSPVASVSLLIPTRNGGTTLRRCIESIQRHTRRGSCEVIVIDNQSTDPATCDFLKACAAGRAGTGPARLRVIPFDAPFNFSAINNQAAAQASGQVLGLINDDIEVLDDGWLDPLVAAALRPALGCVGPQLCYPDGRVQHAGIALGVGGVAAHPHRGFAGDGPGYAGWLQWPRNVSAVTGAALFLRRSLYEHLNGMDENLAVAYNDVDLCLRALAGGWRNCYLPSVRLRHHESFSRGDDRSQAKAERLEREAAILRARWGQDLQQDPYYNPNLSATREDFTLAAPLAPILPGQRPWGRVQRLFSTGGR